MKNLIFILVTLFGTLCSCNKSFPKPDQKEVITKEESDKHDRTAAQLYIKSLNTLDSIVKHSESKDDFASFKAIEILSEISGYAGNGNHSYYGTLGFEDEDLVYWKKWFDENKNLLNYPFHIQSSLEYALNIDKYHVIKIDSLRNFYLVYLKKASNHYKVVSEKIENSEKCQKIKKGDYLSLSLKSVFPDTSKISYKLDGINYKGTEFNFERDSILDIYETDELIGLCIINK